MTGIFSAGVERALRAALDAHRGQLRRGREPVPYATHPLHVALLLARCGADSEVIQAGLLREVVEDAPGWTLDRLESEFGPRVRSIVAELTEEKRRPWQERKEYAIQAVPMLSPEAVLVKACDKLHNLQTLTAELGEGGDLDIWKRFRGGRAQTVHLSRRLVVALETRVPAGLAADLRAALEALEAMTSRG